MRNYQVSLFRFFFLVPGKTLPQPFTHGKKKGRTILL